MRVHAFHHCLCGFDSQILLHLCKLFVVGCQCALNEWYKMRAPSIKEKLVAGVTALNDSS